MINKAAIALLEIYKRYVSPFLGSHCRFIPTCSTYSILVFKKYSFPKAFLLTLLRLLKCHPFHPGGYDPA